MEIRKLVTIVEDIFADGEKKVDRPVRKVAAIAVIKNPCAGVYREDLTELIENGDELGKVLGERAVEALGAGRAAESYGKAAIVGEKGELEHAAALLHPKLGTPLRNAVGGGKLGRNGMKRHMHGYGRAAQPFQGLQSKDALNPGIDGKVDMVDA